MVRRTVCCGWLLASWLVLWFGMPAVSAEPPRSIPRRSPPPWLHPSANPPLRREVVRLPEAAAPTDRPALESPVASEPALPEPELLPPPPPLVEEPRPELLPPGAAQRVHPPRSALGALALELAHRAQQARSLLAPLGPAAASADRQAAWIEQAAWRLVELDSQGLCHCAEACRLAHRLEKATDHFADCAEDLCKRSRRLGVHAVSFSAGSLHHVAECMEDLGDELEDIVD